ncbi:MAG: ROK family protein [Eubacteriales bacterium]|nr:ROK family protein [Eubacteriales bacterium]
MKFYLSYDIGGTNLKVAIIDENFRILGKKSTKANAKERSGEQVIEVSIQLGKDLISELDLNCDSMLAIALGAPGLVDDHSGRFVRASNLNFNDLAVRDLFQKEFSKPVFLINDANAAALAEAELGAGKETDTSVLLILGTGLGAGICIDHKIYTGYSGLASELGHHVIELNGRPCSCGRNGCFEQYSTAGALIRLTEEAIEEEPESILAAEVRDAGRVSGHTAFSAAKKGCSAAAAVLDQYYEYLAEGVANVINFLMPELIIIGGGVSGAGQVLVDGIEAKLDGKVFTAPGCPKTRLVLAAMGNEAGLLGPAIYAATELKC